MDDPATTNDGDLLRRWLDRGEEASFRELVDRYSGLVYHSALRTGGNASLAGEGAQLTFIVLAKRARQLASRPSLAGWLHQTAVFQTRNLVRTQHRETRKLQNLTAMTPDIPPDGASAWREMAPVLDDALAALPENDREAILLRFYRSLSFPEIAATIGIAGGAARKRVDRAVARLRTQLERRGCHLSTTACLGALGNFAAEAKAGALCGGALASNALAATATTTLATGFSSTTIAIIMTKKASIAAGAALLLAGAGAVALINRGDNTDATQTATENSRPGSSRNERSGPGSPRASEASRARPRDPAENPDLVSKYGEARTNLSKFVAGNVIDLLDDALSMGEMASTGLGGALGQRGALMGLGRLGGELNLNEEQRKQAEELVADFQKRELERTKSAVESLRNDPEALMRMMLASDAYSRGEMSEEEYKAAQAGAQTDLAGIMNPLDRQNFQGGRPLGDESFRQGMMAILDPDQASTFESAVQNRTADPGNNGSIADIPAMDLEQLDKTVTSAKSLTSGARQIMEGLGGLQDLGPLLEQQQRRRQQQAD